MGLEKLDLKKVEDVKRYLADGGDPNAEQYYDEPLLSLAVQYGSVESMKELIDAGATISADVIKAAIQYEKAEAIQLFSRSGADLSSAINMHRDGSPHITPLFQAVEWTRPVSIEALIDAGADLDVKSGRGENTPLLLALREVEREVGDEFGSEFIHNSDAEKIACMLIRAGADLHVPDAYGLTPAIWLEDTRNEAILEALAEREAKTLKAEMLEIVQPHLQVKEQDQWEQTYSTKQRRKM